jgi:surface polysaccharide O-acyltransferase-like enzyme
MISVVLVHANFLTTQTVADWWPGGYVAPFIFGLAVPAFFMLSGFVLSSRDNLDLPFDTRGFWRGKLTSVLLPFWVWTAVMMGVSWATDLGAPLSLRYIFYGIAGYWQLYYIFSLIQFFALYILLRPHLKKAGANWILFAAAIASILIFAGSSIELWLGGEDDGFPEEVLSRVSLTWAVFFFFGVWLGRRPEVLERLSRFALLLLLLAMALYVPYYLEVRHWDLTFGQTPPRMQLLGTGLAPWFVGGLALLVLAYRLDRSRAGRGILRPLTWLGADSMGIYVCHTTFLMVAVYVLIRLDLADSAWGKIPSLWGLSFLASWAFVRLMRLPALRWPGFVLFGRRVARRP